MAKNEILEGTLELIEDSENDLVVDKDNKYNFDELTKAFIHLYCETSSLEFICRQLNLTLAQGEKLISNYYVMLEIKRINKAMYQKAFGKQMLNLQQIGGYLTSLVTDEVPTTQRLNSKDKLEAIKMLTTLNIRQEELMQQPRTEIIIQQEENVEEELKKLSLASIKQLITTKEDENKRKELIKELKNKRDYSIEELCKFDNMSVQELEKINNRTTAKSNLTEVHSQVSDSVMNLKNKIADVLEKQKKEKKGKKKD